VLGGLVRKIVDGATVLNVGGPEDLAAVEPLLA
jgi:hypothetical protein